MSIVYALVLRNRKRYGGAMSLVGRAATNHPQQVAVRGARDEDDDRAITMADFAPIHARFGFTIDAAAASHNARLPRFWTRQTDALAQSWAGERVWCNPPYSNLRPWMEKALTEVDCPLIVFLLPNNRFEQAWWHDTMEPLRRDGVVTVEMLRGRMRFERPTVVIGPKGDRPPFGCVLLIIQRDGGAT